MSEKNKGCCELPGVGCGVISCKYHTADNCCTAERIDVQNGSAQRKVETFCSTFTPKGSM